MLMARCLIRAAYPQSQFIDLWIHNWNIEYSLCKDIAAVIVRGYRIYLINWQSKINKETPENLNLSIAKNETLLYKYNNIINQISKNIYLLYLFLNKNSIFKIFAV